MCGRFALTLPPQAMRALFGYVEQPNFPARYNIAPHRFYLVGIGKDKQIAGGHKQNRRVEVRVLANQQEDTAAAAASAANPS